MKRITRQSLLLMAILCSSGIALAQEVWDGVVATGFHSGYGYSYNPYVIKTPGEFAYFIKQIQSGVDYSGAYIRLDKDINMNSVALGHNGTSCTFGGNFNGNGHFVYGLYAGSYRGLFGTLSGVIRNLGIQESVPGENLCYTVSSTGLFFNCYLDFKLVGGEYATDAPYAYLNQGEIVNCHSTGTFGGGRRSDFRSIAYVNGGKIINCTTTTIKPLANNNYTSALITNDEADWLAWRSNHTRYDYTSPLSYGSTCTIEYKDPMGIMESTTSITVPAGEAIGELAAPKGDATFLGWKRNNSFINSDTKVERDLWTLYPAWEQNIRVEPTQTSPTFEVDDKAHAQYQWYKTNEESLFLGEWTSTNKNDDSSSYQTFTFEGGGVLSFDYNVSSEESCDYLTVTLDGAQILRVSGEVSKVFQMEIAKASHTLRFQYTKDYSVSSGKDMASITAIRVGGMGSELPGATKETLDITREDVSRGNKYYCTVAYTNSAKKLSSTAFEITEKSQIIADATPIEVERQYIVDKLYYTRNFNNTNWQALYVPFSLSYDDWKEDFEVARINAFYEYDNNHDGVIDQQVLEVFPVGEGQGDLRPNYPYLIKAKTSGAKSLTLTDATLYATEVNSIECSTVETRYTFTGTYEKMTGLASAGYYFMSGGGLKTTSSDATALGAFRWYLKAESKGSSLMQRPAEIKIRVVGEEGEETGITDVNADEEKSAVFTLDGRKVNSNRLTPGIYIKNGKKVYVR